MLKYKVSKFPFLIAETMMKLFLSEITDPVLYKRK
jgi:hypothetical protein